MDKAKLLQINRQRRRVRVRARISGTAMKPRLNVARSLRGVFVQLIDDTAGKTILSLHSKTLSKVKLTDAGERKGKVALSYLTGRKLAEMALEKKITEAVFDRSSYKYHGRISAVAEGARAGGLKF